MNTFAKTLIPTLRLASRSNLMRTQSNNLFGLRMFVDQAATTSYLNSQRYFSTENKAAEEKPATEQAEGEKSAAEPTLEEQIADLKKQLEDKHTQLLYTAAERENVRRWGKEEVDKAKKFGAQSLTKDLLEVVDQLELALAQFTPEQLQANKELSNLYEGVKMTENLFLKVMGNNGVVRFDPIGEKFDPNVHHALFQVPDASCDAGTIKTVVKKGFKLNDRLVRPAQVGVSKK
ncbi:molecular chaperone [Heterostelium album PN500]|uniref:GrpE protein homolog n=1 Tax=Heterostelium pallidum (strain ATCC 26659 / Pp 5 / PN500) TaxID=670386 RepID=D3BP66_HETP5|nr:molecular chaperone [Heterostelium album PN500]EFA77076.1 molecular chaperone [Heterostelium album PN500]|eukprot:XP_020429205.1 molecular chaperone [Heterostelium album PN500]